MADSGKETTAETTPDVAHALSMPKKGGAVELPPTCTMHSHEAGNEKEVHVPVPSSTASAASDDKKQQEPPQDPAGASVTKLNQKAPPRSGIPPADADADAAASPHGATLVGLPNTMTRAPPPPVAAVANLAASVAVAASKPSNLPSPVAAVKLPSNLPPPSASDPPPSKPPNPPPPVAAVKSPNLAPGKESNIPPPAPVSKPSIHPPASTAGKPSVPPTIAPKSVPPPSKKRKLVNTTPAAAAAAAPPVPPQRPVMTPHTPLADPAVVNMVHDIIGLLQTYGPLSFGQLEYNLPPIASLRDILDVMVVMGVVQVVDDGNDDINASENVRYCMLHGIPRADVVLPQTVVEDILDAQKEVTRSKERCNILKQALLSEKSQNPREVLKQVLLEYPEIAQDPIYAAALRNVHVDVGAVDRERYKRMQKDASKEVVVVASTKSELVEMKPSGLSVVPKAAIAQDEDMVDEKKSVEGEKRACEKV